MLSYVVVIPQTYVYGNRHTVTNEHLDVTDAFQRLSDTYYATELWVSSVRNRLFCLCHSFLLFCLLCYILSQRIKVIIRGFGSSWSVGDLTVILLQRSPFCSLIWQSIHSCLECT